jgi:predicted enzyme related to lactoylglutathione lyase
MLTGIMSANVYVDDFDRAVRFYRDVLKLKRGIAMGETSCFFWIGQNEYGLFVDGGYQPRRAADDQARASVTFKCASAHALFERLAQSGLELLSDAPKDMGKGYFWFQFRDPAGNILEAISGPNR